MIIYKELTVNDIDLSVFAFFDRTQNVTKCWRKINDEWLIKDVPFIDNWSEEEYKEGVQYLKNLIKSNGYVIGAFYNGQLKGFASVEPAIFGTHAKYMELSNIHVSRDMRGQGIGKELFSSAKKGKSSACRKIIYISSFSNRKSSVL